MPLLNETNIRKLAKVRTMQANDSASDILDKTHKASADSSSFQIFLSHSYLDKELILGIMEYLNKLGYTVYVDWKQDAHLSRDNITKKAAELLRKRLMQSDSLLFATTVSTKESRWMPWELGFMDGRKGRSAVLPVSGEVESDDTYKGQEYLGIYPYVTSGMGTVHHKEMLWVHEDANTYVSFDAWLKGKEPSRRG